MKKTLTALVVGAALSYAPVQAGFWDYVPFVNYFTIGKKLGKIKEEMNEKAKNLYAQQQIVQQNPDINKPDSFADKSLHWCGNGTSNNRTVFTANIDGKWDIYEATDNNYPNRLTYSDQIEEQPFYNSHDGHISWRQKVGDDVEYWQLHGTTPTLITTRNTHYK